MGSRLSLGMHVFLRSSRLEAGREWRNPRSGEGIGPGREVEREKAVQSRLRYNRSQHNALCCLIVTSFFPGVDRFARGSLQSCSIQLVSRLRFAVRLSETDELSHLTVVDGWDLARCWLMSSASDLPGFII